MMVPLDFATVRDAALGGVLIGGAAVGLLLVDGHIAGVSGILGDAVRFRPGWWRWMFLAGLVASSFVAPFVGIAPVVPTHQVGLLGLGVRGCWLALAPRSGRDAPAGMAFAALPIYRPALLWRPLHS